MAQSDIVDPCNIIFTYVTANKSLKTLSDVENMLQGFGIEWSDTLQFYTKGLLAQQSTNDQITKNDDNTNNRIFISNNISN